MGPSHFFIKSAFADGQAVSLLAEGTRQAGCMMAFEILKGFEPAGLCEDTTLESFFGQFMAEFYWTNTDHNDGIFATIPAPSEGEGVSRLDYLRELDIKKRLTAYALLFAAAADKSLEAKIRDPQQDNELIIIGGLTMLRLLPAMQLYAREASALICRPRADDGGKDGPEFYARGEIMARANQARAALHRYIA